jgi:prepilin-type N-terminal cleavage/methylation domain-containing protein
MKTFLPSPALAKMARAFTLVETLIAVAIFAIGSGVLYQSFMASVFLTAKNISLNSGNTGLQYGYNRLLSALESAPLFVDCANYNPSTGTFTAVATGSWGNSVRFMRLLPIACYVQPDDGSGYTVTNPPPATRSVYLKSTDQFVFVTYNTSLYSAAIIPMSARLYPAFPSITQTVVGGTSPGVKPGLSFDVMDNTSTPGVIGMHFPTALGANNFQDCNRAYFMVESAFAVTQTATDGHKDLLYFADTSQTSNPVVVCRNLDGANQTQANDPSIPTGGTPGTFSIVATGDAVQTLLPIRSAGAVNVMTRRGGAAARNNTWINVNIKFRQREDL